MFQYHATHCYVMTKSTTAQMQADPGSTHLLEKQTNERNDDPDNVEECDPESIQAAKTLLTLRIPLGVSSINQQQNGAHKRHQSLSPAPSSQRNGSRPGSPPHTPPKLSHHSPVKNGHACLHEETASARCPAPKSPPTPHKIRLLEEKENDAKPKRNLNLNGSLGMAPAVQQSGTQPEKVELVAQLIAEPQKPSQRVQTRLSDFFPVRRSDRRTKSEVEATHQQRMEERLICNNDFGLPLKIQQFSEKGRGVVATRKLTKGEFVVEYSGDLIDVKSARERENKYAMDLSKGCYMYYFRANNKQYCIDATSESGRFGRLVNHSRSTPNLQTKVITFRNQPRLILVAKRDIEAGEELLYDYGDRSRESIESYPWLAL